MQNMFLTAVIPTAAEDLRGGFDVVGVVGNWGIRACCCTCRTCCCTTEVALVFSDNLRHTKHHHCQVHLLRQWNTSESVFLYVSICLVRSWGGKNISEYLKTEISRNCMIKKGNLRRISVQTTNFRWTSTLRLSEDLAGTFRTLQSQLLAVH